MKTGTKEESKQEKDRSAASNSDAQKMLSKMLGKMDKTCGESRKVIGEVQVQLKGERLYKAGQLLNNTVVQKTA